MPKPVAGMAFIKVDSKQYNLRGNLKIKIAKVEREGIVGLDGVHGHKVTPVLPSFEMDITDAPDLSIEELNAIEDATITVELLNGKNYLLRNAWCASAIELDAAEGQFTASFEGMSGEEITNAG